MALLPCLRWDDARWWLPLRSETAEVLAALMTSAPEPPSGASANSLTGMLVRDPALLTFVTLRWLAAKDSRVGKKVRIDRLASWFRPRIVRIFSEGDSFLGQPAVSSEMGKRWSELSREATVFQPKHFRSVAEQWLQVAGPSVPDSWKARWPRPRPAKTRVALDCRETACGDPSSVPQAADEAAGSGLPLASLSLPHLARQIKCQRALQTRFAEQLRSEKLASLKQFAYGLSHEINNPLANIVTRTQQLQRSESDGRRRESMERIVGQAMRAHEMIADVMFFAHPPEPQRQRVCLAEVVETAMGGFRERCQAASIALVGDPARADAMEVWADPSMLHDAVGALLRNAIEAIGCDGVIRVESGWRGKRRRKAFVQVADSGPGLTDEALRHAFDPYYSGREAGRGLGLGLCRVYRVAKQHGGSAKLRSGAGGCLARMWIRVDGGESGPAWDAPGAPDL